MRKQLPGLPAQTFAHAVNQTIKLANTRSHKATAAADIHLHVSPAPLCAQPAHGPALLYMSQMLLSD